jgi:uncharacterized protein YcnI
MIRRIVRTALAGTTLGLVAVISIAGPASAHVTVNPRDAAQGDYTRVAFRVPNETEKANTTKLEVQLPTDHPIASVSLMAVPGWTAETQKKKLDTPIKSDDGEITEAVSVITWTAGADAAIKPGQFQEFPVSLGPLPKVDNLTFKALQTYDDGNVVRWIDEASGSTEPEHPAPVLKLTVATDPGAASPTPVASAGRTDPSDDSSRGLALAGLVAGVLGLLLGGAAFIRAARRTEAPPAA